MSAITAWNYPSCGIGAILRSEKTARRGASTPTGSPGMELPMPCKSTTPPLFAETTPEYPRGYGLCSCGCGGLTRRIQKTSTRDGHVRGQYFRFLPHHGATVSVDARLRVHVNRSGPTDCWMWEGYTTPLGYGEIQCGGRGVVRVHRIAYERWIGPIAAGYHVHHECGTPACVNPHHLRAMPASEHARHHSEHLAKINRGKTHCKRGHLLSGENVYVIPSTGGRQCRECRRILFRRRRTHDPQWAASERRRLREYARKKRATA